MNRVPGDPKRNDLISIRLMVQIGVSHRHRYVPDVDIAAMGEFSRWDVAHPDLAAGTSGKESPIRFDSRVFGIVAIISKLSSSKIGDLIPLHRVPSQRR